MTTQKAVQRPAEGVYDSWNGNAVFVPDADRAEDAGIGLGCAWDLDMGCWVPMQAVNRFRCFRQAEDADYDLAGLA